MKYNFLIILQTTDKSIDETDSKHSNSEIKHKEKSQVNNDKKEDLKKQPIKLKSGNFECPYCQKTFPRLSNIQDHINIHTGEKPHECPHCDQTFAQRNARFAHIENEHKVNLKIIGTHNLNHSFLFIFYSYRCHYINNWPI